jgi:hypothetical protein
MSAKHATGRAAQAAISGALSLGLMGGSAPADSQQAKLTVSATVLKRATLKVVAQPSSVVVTASDLARGYVDVPASAHLEIRSNTPDGYLLEFASEGGFLREILVTGLASQVQLSPAGGMVMQPSDGARVTTLHLGFRFFLAQSAGTGTYAWPMRVFVTPI